MDRPYLLGLLAVVGTALASTPCVAELSVYSVNYPLAYFAERIGDEAVKVRFPVPAGVDPAFWRPDPETIGAYQAADLILLNGAGYAKWIGQASLPRRKLVDTSRSFRDAYLPGEETPVHQHGPAGEHTHGQVAFTTWLDPVQAIAQARSIEAAFVRRDPENAFGFAGRADALVADLERLDRDLAAALAAVADEPLLASHPVYSYLARRYGLDLRSFTWEPDADPAAADWRTFDALLAERPARWMLWEARPLDSTAAKLEERGVGVLVFEISANRPASGDFLATIRANLEALNDAVGLP
jgi:zinc transport system substrate-binding protein